MFGLFKRKDATLVPDEPIELRLSIEIESAADHVYSLLDWSDERNQMRARGNIVRQEADTPETYRLWYDRTPELNFLFTVIEAVPAQEYAFTALIVPPVGLRVASEERYTIEPLGEGRCRVIFVNTVVHQPGLTQRQLASEVAMSSKAAANGMTKLKLQAEQGAEAVAQFEREMGQR